MYELKKNVESYLRVNLLGPGPRLIKKNLPGRGLTKVEKHRIRRRPKINRCRSILHVIVSTVVLRCQGQFCIYDRQTLDELLNDAGI